MRDYTALHINLDRQLKHMPAKEKMDFIATIVQTLYEEEFKPENQELISYLITTGRMFDAGRIAKWGEDKP